VSAARRLIVNADDLGRTSGVNRGIVAAHRLGIVTSATLMVTHAAAAEAARLARENSALGLGLHAALTGGAPALPPERVPTLVDAQGRLPPKPEGLAGADPRELRAELRAQLERFERLVGRAPTHFDSHHHAHRLPAVLDALVELARETGLPVRGASPGVRDRLRAAGVATPDRFVESFYRDGATLDGLLAIVRGLEPGVTELMCHPAYADDELRAGSSYADERERELRALTSDEVRAALSAADVELVSFAAFRGGASSGAGA
jgi:hypothetical protein